MSRNLYQRVGAHVRGYRKLAHMTQEVLAEKADISVHHLGFIERGQAKPSLDTLERIAAAVGKRTEDLFQAPRLTTKHDPQEAIQHLILQLKRCSPDHLRQLSNILLQLLELLPPAK